MDYAEIENRVKRVLADKLNFPIEKINAASCLQEDLGMDSFGAIEMIFELEEKFAIKIDDEEMRNVRTVQDVLAYIKNRLGKQPC